MNLRNKRIGVVGLGYVGLPLAVCFAEKYHVVGFDVDGSRIDELKQGLDRTNEQTPQDLANLPNLIFSKELNDLEDCQIYIVTVPTPVDSANKPDLQPLTLACEMIGTLLAHDDIVIFESTVYPGATEDVCVPILEKISGLRYNEGFFCGYSPERINPGDKVNTIKTIKKITSGSVPSVAAHISDLYGSVITAGTWPAKSIAVAEAAKVIENSQRDLNIAFVNELSIIFERLNIDTTEVLEAAGSKWNFIPFRPGMVGGHCIGVDPYYLAHKAEQMGYNPQVIMSGRRINDNMARYAARSVIKRMVKNNINITDSCVGVLGVTFKENCPDIRNSKVLDLINEFKSWGIKVVAIDSWVSLEDKTRFEVPFYDLNECPTLSSAVIAVGHSDFKALTPEQIYKMCDPGLKPVLGDLKSVFNRQASERAGFTVFRL